MEAFWLVTLRPFLAELALPPTPLLIALALCRPLLRNKPRAGRAAVAAVPSLAISLWLTGCLGASLVVREWLCALGGA